MLPKPEMSDQDLSMAGDRLQRGAIDVELATPGAATALMTAGADMGTGLRPGMTPMGGIAGANHSGSCLVNELVNEVVFRVYCEDLSY